MLNEEDEYRLAAVLGITREDLRQDPNIYAYEYRVDAVLWLADKLKEVNDELKKEKLITQKQQAAINIMSEDLNSLRGRYNRLKVETEDVPPAEIVIVNPSYGRIIP